MYDERIDGRLGYSTDYPYVEDPQIGHAQSDYPYTGGLGGSETGRGTGRHRAPTQFFAGPLVPPDSAWDPAEELAFMLQDAMEQQQQRPTSRTARDEPEPGAPAAKSGNTPLENLQEITAELPPLRDVSRGHRKVRERRHPNMLRTASHLIAALAAVIASTVSFFGGMVAYDPLHIVAVPRVHDGIASWWPLLVYGPWLVASLSVLRAALHQRRAVHSWCVVLLFSSVAMLLCVVQAPRTLVDMSAAALPGLASLACFQQLVRQITLTRPPRRATPRHRLSRPAQPDTFPTPPSMTASTTPEAGEPKPKSSSAAIRTS
ncbi:hypothetical protein [Streptomyces sp. MK5]|uniref:hypothetical protein n=1 Tax=Streptomyces sp. MK5 TaxID=3064253 RepID=UPI002741BFA3|nr:hypothetical protein [Streptomyces sp. MK5]